MYILKFKIPNGLTIVTNDTILKVCVEYHVLHIFFPFYLPPAGREIIKRILCVCACVIECVSCFYKGCTSHWLFLLGLFNVFYDLIAYVLSFDAVISHLGP